MPPPNKTKLTVDDKAQTQPQPQRQTQPQQEHYDLFHHYIKSS